jgi:hypothetical protein
MTDDSDSYSYSSTSSNGPSNGDEITRSDASGTSGTPSRGNQDASSVKLGQKENTLVWRSRMLVLLVLLLATISASIITYHFTKREEQEDFKTRVRLFWITKLKRLKVFTF